MRIYGKKGSRSEIYIEYENEKKYLAIGEMLTTGDFWIYCKKTIKQIEPTVRNEISFEEFEKIKNDITKYNEKVRCKIIIG